VAACPAQWCRPMVALQFIKLAPSAEWAQYGFPASVNDVAEAKQWTINVGQATSRVTMAGSEPAVRNFHTLVRVVPIPPPLPFAATHRGERVASEDRFNPPHTATRTLPTPCWCLRVTECGPRNGPGQLWFGGRHVGGSQL
jgi:hypothetical protein